LADTLSRNLKKQGNYVRALARTDSKLDTLEEYIDEKFIGEVTNLDSLSDICDGIDIVFSSVGITKQKDGLTYMDVDYQGNMNLLEKAKKAGVSKFIYISVLNAEHMWKLKAIQAKLKFEQALEDTGINYTIIHPNGFFSDMLEYLKMAQKGKGYVFGTGENKINPIHGEDLAKVCVQAASGHEKMIKIGGPDILTHNEILTLAFEALGKNIKTSGIPIWVRNSILTLMRIFTPEKVYGPSEFFMTVLAEDMIAPKYGNHHLKDYFVQSIDNENI